RAASRVFTIPADRRVSRRDPSDRTGSGSGRLDHRPQRAANGRGADTARGERAQCASTRARALHPLCLFLSGGRRRAVGCDGRCDRPDAAAQTACQTAEYRRADCAHEGECDRDRQSAAGSGPVEKFEGNNMTIGLGHYLTVGAILFTIGIFGIFLNRKNVIIILMSIELILLAVNVNLVAFSAFLGDLVGQVYALLVLTVAAAEAAIGLAILVAYYRNRGSIAVEDINLMKG